MAKIGHSAGIPLPAESQEVNDDEMEVLGIDDEETSGDQADAVADDDSDVWGPDAENTEDTGDAGDEGDAEGSEEGIETDESAPGPSGADSPARPDYLPDVIDWDTLPADQKLLVENVYAKGQAAAAAEYTDDDRAIIARARELRARPAETTAQPEVPQLEAPDIQLPDEYKDDAGLVKYNQMINAHLARQTEYTNAIIGELVKVRGTVANVSSGQTQTTLQMAWARFQGSHPEVNDQKVWDALNEKMQLVNPQIPVDQQWEVALGMTGYGGKKTNKTPDDVLRRGQAVRAVRAASGSAGRRVTGKIETTEDQIEGLSFIDTYRVELKNGTLPSQG